jgi:hypothetical protein
MSTSIARPGPSAKPRTRHPQGPPLGAGTYPRQGGAIVDWELSRYKTASTGTMSEARSPTIIWMGCAFGAALGLASAVLLALGSGERGTDVALQATARLSFLLFWPAYAGGTLAKLFGSPFDSLHQRTRDFGLAFASTFDLRRVCNALSIWRACARAAKSITRMNFDGSRHLSCPHRLDLVILVPVKDGVIEAISGNDLEQACRKRLVRHSFEHCLLSESLGRVFRDRKP